MKSILLPVALTALMLPLGACSLDDDTEDYTAWREQNDEYIANINTAEYTKIVPDWAPNNSVYIKWHNDRSLTAANLVPLSTSTVSIKYEFENIEGTKLGNSYRAASGDSVYQSCPNQNILGMWIALTNMHVGDSVTMIIPYPSAYGNQLNATIKPYSNLIYRVKMKSIDAYERPE